MKNYKLEDIEYLRTKAPISYEEAVVLLDKYDGDMSRALVELEKRGLLGNKSSSAGNKSNNRGRGFWEAITDGLKFLFRKHMIVTRGDKVIIDLPLAVWILLFIVFYKVLLIGIILVLIFGLRIDFNNTDNPDVDTKIDSIIDKASSAINNTINPHTGDSKKAEHEESIHVPAEDVIVNVPEADVIINTEPKPVKADAPDTSEHSEIIIE